MQRLEAECNEYGGGHETIIQSDVPYNTGCEFKIGAILNI
jgi:hypothetical protein